MALPSPILTPSSLVLPQRPAFLSFTPSPSPSLVVSTYQLDASCRTQSRSGALHVFPSASFSSLSASSSTLIPTSGGVFRFHFLHDQPQKVVAALTTGSLALVDIDACTVHETVVSSGMLLDCSSRPSSDSVISSSNDGSLSLSSLHDSRVLSHWSAHSLQWTKEPCEVWTVSWLSPSTVSSGGEDATLRVWDVREEPMKEAMCIKTFNAGVTFSRGLDENVIVTGSYDQNIRTFDLRNVKCAAKEVETKGGVWNMSCLPSIGWLCACMYGGWLLLDHHLTPLARSTHAGTSLLYGADLSPSCDTLAYCTFNDYTLTTLPCHGIDYLSQLFPIS